MEIFRGSLADDEAQLEHAMLRIAGCGYEYEMNIYQRQYQNFQ